MLVVVVVVAAVVVVVNFSFSAQRVRGNGACFLAAVKNAKKLSQSFHSIFKSGHDDKKVFWSIQEPNFSTFFFCRHKLNSKIRFTYRKNLKESTNFPKKPLPSFSFEQAAEKKKSSQSIRAITF
jgi:hypothetical protein